MTILNQKTAKVTYRIPGELNNGDIAQCPCCRKKFVVLPGMIQYKIGGGADVICPECGQTTDAEYFKANPPELPPKKRGKKE